MQFAKDYLIPTLVLTLICVVVSVALVYTQGVTDPIIKQAEKAAAELARVEVLSTADTFTKLEMELPKGVAEAYKADNGTGYVITASCNGYNGAVVVMIGINADGTISKTKVLTQAETPGIGTRILEASFIDTFVGKDKDLEGVTSITGATYSSNAFIGSVKLALDSYTLASGGEVKSTSPVVVLTEEFMAASYPAGTTFKKLSLDYEAYSCAGNGYVVSGYGSGYYDDDIIVAVFFNEKDEVINLAFTQLNETQGAGTRVTEPAFKEQFIGKSSTDGVDIISGATQSSKGTIRAVSRAIERLPEVKEAS